MANYLKGQWVGPGCFDLATTTDEDWQDLVNLSDKSSLLSDQLQQIREDFASEFTGDCKSADCKLYNKGLFTCLPRNSTKHHILGKDQTIYRVKPDEKFNYKLAETIPPPETE
jgi:predicted  nucleic acid-binding Zn ribbon protein